MGPGVRAREELRRRTFRASPRSCGGGGPRMVAHNVGAVSQQASENSSYQMNVSTHVLSEKRMYYYLMSWFVRARLTYAASAAHIRHKGHE